MAKIKSICFFTWLLLFTFSETNAISKRDVENVCKETTDPNFCVTQIETDPRTGNVGGLSSLLVLVISLTKMQVDDATTHLRSVDQNYNGPNWKRRVNFCKTNYETASAKFQTAWETALTNSFADAHILLIDGEKAVTDCENGWTRGGPPQKSPLTLYNTNVSKLYDVIRVIIKRLGS